MITYHQHDNGQSPPFEYISGKEGETFSVGEALTLAAGALTKCAATVIPDYIAMGPAGANGLVPCSRVNETIGYDAPLSAAGAALKLGDKVTLSADAMGVTATKAGGVATIERIDGTEEGDIVGVRFVRTAAAASNT